MTPHAGAVWPMFTTSDTIVAIATPRGRGGVGMVRLSGPHSTEIARRLVSLPSEWHLRRATLARVIDHVNDQVVRTVDEVVVTRFAAPHSYTGDDVVEICGHGSPVLLEQIVARLVAAGARLAEPGEFTLRAYLNGRIDLVQAEAVNDLVNAVTPLQARVAMDQLDGTLSRAVGAIDRQVLDVIARCEASLDFPDEGFHFFEETDFSTHLHQIAGALDVLLSTASHGRLLRDGLTIALAGRPNVGKSSLFNALLQRDRAIVTDVPGTTRDVLSERMDIEGIQVSLLDTAGLRESEDAIEREGVTRAEAVHRAADVVLVAIDASVPVADTDRALLESTRMRPRIVVATKSDRGRCWGPADVGLAEDDVMATSVVTHEGLAALRTRIVDGASLSLAAESPVITNLRHQSCLREARSAIARAIDAFDRRATEEMVVVDLHDARAALEAITGRRTIDDLLHHIFSNFCIGK